MKEKNINIIAICIGAIIISAYILGMCIWQCASFSEYSWPLRMLVFLSGILFGMATGHLFNIIIKTTRKEREHEQDK